MIDYTLILTTFYAGTQWALYGEEYSGLDWLDSTPKPTQAELDALWAPLLAERARTAYIALRAAAYPTQNEQNDMAYWDRQNGTTTLDDAITAVKTKYPKEAA